MEQPSIIYLFVSPSGRAYAGWHGCDPEGWTRRGTGPLPSGYRGSGKLWASVTRRHGPAIHWVILRRFPAGTPRAVTGTAEQRAIRLVRAVWGERCANILAGGEGMTSDDARAFWADPSFAQRTKAAIKTAMARPSTKAKTRRHIKRLNDDPDWQERRAAGLTKAREAAAAPEVRARANAANRATHQALAQTPKRRELFARAAKVGHRKRRAAKMLAPLMREPVILSPGLTVWDAPPGAPLSVAGFSLKVPKPTGPRPRGKGK